MGSWRCIEKEAATKRKKSTTDFTEDTDQTKNGLVVP